MVRPSSLAMSNERAIQAAESCCAAYSRFSDTHVRRFSPILVVAVTPGKFRDRNVRELYLLFHKRNYDSIRQREVETQV